MNDHNPPFFPPDAEIEGKLVRDYEPAVFRQLLEAAPPTLPYSRRAEVLCDRLAGSPYRTSPLGGGPGQAEAFTVHLGGFDCVTLFETVTALALSASEPEFLRRLHRMRYRDGRTDYLTRRHYMSLWREENEREGRVAVPPGLPPEREWRRDIGVLPAFGSFSAWLGGWPKTCVRRLAPGIRSGDLVFFISCRRRLDYFHTGILRSDGTEIRLFHASQSRGEAVEVPLRDFLGKNRMTGLTLLRPLPFHIT